MWIAELVCGLLVVVPWHVQDEARDGRECAEIVAHGDGRSTEAVVERIRDDLSQDERVRASLG